MSRIDELRWEIEELESDCKWREELIERLQEAKKNVKQEKYYVWEEKEEINDSTIKFNAQEVGTEWSGVAYNRLDSSIQGEVLQYSDKYQKRIQDTIGAIEQEIKKQNCQIDQDRDNISDDWDEIDRLEEEDDDDDEDDRNTTADNGSE